MREKGLLSLWGIGTLLQIEVYTSCCTMKERSDTEVQKGADTFCAWRRSVNPIYLLKCPKLKGGEKSS